MDRFIGTNCLIFVCAHSYRKHLRAKDVSNYSKEDLSAIFGGVPGADANVSNAAVAATAITQSQSEQKAAQSSSDSSSDSDDSESEQVWLSLLSLGLRITASYFCFLFCLLKEEEKEEEEEGYEKDKTAGVTTTTSSMSMDDYFKQKMGNGMLTFSALLSLSLLPESFAKAPRAHDHYVMEASMATYTLLCSLLSALCSLFPWHTYAKAFDKPVPLSISLSDILLSSQDNILTLPSLSVVLLCCS